MLSRIIEAIQGLRVPKIIDEYQLQKMVEVSLLQKGICCNKEYHLGPRSRIDFYHHSGIGIEIKKGKPVKSQVIAQLERYTLFTKIAAVVLIVEQNIHDIPEEINGKTCVVIALNKLWGIAL